MASKSSYEPSYVIEIPAGSLSCSPFLSGAAEQLFVIAAARQVQQRVAARKSGSSGIGESGFLLLCPCVCSRLSYGIGI